MSPLCLALGLATLCAAAAGFHQAYATATERELADEPGRSARLGILIHGSAGLLAAGAALFLEALA
ncbi:hypothetical protein [Rhodobacter lacus]|uniref:DUF423 domain-containing protein n=1 Tax=Rhodobacter lacus TaxID=1641972 RepID=A0ABW5A8I4_9RHOB